MPIPSVPLEALHAAMARFDHELRDTPDWAGWESNKAHLYAIAHAGQRYPVKQVVSMATGLPVVASDLPVHREITGGAARFFNPFSPEELADRVVHLSQSAETRKNQTEAGLKQAAAFSWAKHVDGLVELAASLAPSTR